MKLRSLLTRHRSDLALVIGNGINRFGQAQSTNSWNDLLKTLAKRFLDAEGQFIPAGIALTEFYDLMELQSGLSPSDISLQKQFCDLMQAWEPHDHHRRIVQWAEKAECPILTTNFDKALTKAGDYKLFRIHRNRFTDYYPWETYYGNRQLEDPSVGFGIWHINGMEHYRRSIRLGLTHYMGSVQRARDWIHRGEDKRLFSGQEIRSWRGADTWLHSVFHKPLLFFGLGLEQNEVFLRWLLIERARYFKKFPCRRKDAWYMHTDNRVDPGKSFFLKGVGVKPTRARDFDDLYGAETWV